MHINYILNLGQYRKSYGGSGSFELTGSAIAQFDLSYIGSGSFELIGNAGTKLKIPYNASGSFELIGSANVDIPQKVYKNIKFSINQIGTTYNNKKYTVYKVQGFGNNPIYGASNTLDTNLFDNQNLFTDSEITSILSKKYDNKIQKYNDIINYINQKLNTTPLPVDDEIMTNIKFNLQETFVNLLNQNKEVISVQGEEKNPEYVSQSQIAFGNKALTPPENTEYTQNKNNNLIFVYENKLNIINNKLNGMTPIINIPQKTNAKFYLKEDGFNNMNQSVAIKSIIGSTNQISYNSSEGVYKQDQLLDDSEASNYFVKKYDNQLNKYFEKLAEINGRLNVY